MIHVKIRNHQKHEIVLDTRATHLSDWARAKSAKIATFNDTLPHRMRNGPWYMHTTRKEMHVIVLPWILPLYQIQISLCMQRRHNEGSSARKGGWMVGCWCTGCRNKSLGLCEQGFMVCRVCSTRCLVWVFMQLMCLLHIEWASYIKRFKKGLLKLSV